MDASAFQNGGFFIVSPGEWNKLNDKLRVVSADLESARECVQKYIADNERLRKENAALRHDYELLRQEKAALDMSVSAAIAREPYLRGKDNLSDRLISIRTEFLAPPFCVPAEDISACDLANLIHLALTVERARS